MTPRCSMKGCDRLAVTRLIVTERVTEYELTVEMDVCTPHHARIDISPSLHIVATTHITERVR